jgi:hypothetical protein
MNTTQKRLQNKIAKLTKELSYAKVSKKTRSRLSGKVLSLMQAEAKLEQIQKSKYQLSDELENEKENIKKFISSQRYLKHNGLIENSIESIIIQSNGILTPKEYIKFRYRDSQVYSNAVYHRSPNGVSKLMKKQKENDIIQHGQLSDKLLNLGSREYNELLKKGMVRPPTRDESLARIAAGHPDNASVQAARRLIEKRKLNVA